MRSRYINGAAMAVFAVSLCACSNPDINAYAGKAPAMTVQSFYGAPIEGYGIFETKSGEVKDRYYATLIPTWNGNEGTIVEKQWNDKGKLFFQQTWHLHVAANGHDFTGTATQIDGPIHGEAAGDALHMTYVLKSPTDSGDEIKLSADDWTYLQPDGSGINRVALSKYGFHVGDVTYDLHPVPKGGKLHEGYFIP